jgi:polysaccharide biosynthesis/export protein
MKGSSLVRMLTILLCLWSLGAYGDESYRLGPGDVVRISVYDHPDLDTVVRIEEDGSVAFPLVGLISLGGMTAREAERSVEEALTRMEIVKFPQVMLIVDAYQSKQVSVLGHLRKPGMYTITRKSTVLDLVSQAGGVSEGGGDVAILTRIVDGTPQRTVVELTPILEGEHNAIDPEVVNGDKIFVPAMDTFFIYGQVNRPGMYRVEPNMTVMHALAVAGGLTDKGTERGITVYRESGEGMQGVAAELADGIRSGDVVYVKESLF